jgi:hypothetical protein
MAGPPLLHGMIQATIYMATFSSPPEATSDTFQQPIHKVIISILVRIIVIVAAI